MKPKKLDNKGLVVATILTSTLVVVAIGLLAMGVALFFVAGIVIDSLIIFSIVALGLLCGLCALVRITGINPFTFEKGEGQFDTGSIGLLGLSLVLLFGMPYMSAGATEEYNLQEQLSTVADIIGEYGIYLAIFVFVVGAIILNEKTRKKLHKKLWK